jgi:hypothetical protein
MDSLSRSAAKPARRWAPTISVAGMIVGAVLLVVGLAWKPATTPETFWTAEQAQELKAASDALHDHSEGGHDHAAGEADAHAVEARARYARIQAELESAQFARDRVGPLLTRAGLAVTIAFGIGYMISRGNE